MKKFKIPLLIFGLMFLAGYAGFFMHNSLNGHRTAVKEPSTTKAETRLISPSDMLLIGLPRPEFEMKDLDGKLHSVSEWDGKILVLNFWATWCSPCRKELPIFVELQKKYADQGLQFLGLAVDTPEEVKSFMETLPLNYPTLVGEDDAMDIARIYGNNIGALPYTVIINRSGKIVFTRKGDMKKSEAEKMFSSIFNQETSN